MEKNEEKSVQRTSSKNSRNFLELVESMKDFNCSPVKEHGQCLNSATSMMTINPRDNKLMGERSKVPFHIPSIPKPQDEFNIFVNNLNQPFDHVWLQRSLDGSRYVHPLEKLSELEFVDKDVGCIEPLKPLPIEDTPFKLVEEVRELKQLAEKLRSVDEFAVDLEHNKYRSFQGLTCLMQISTRVEDYIVDTLKLRVHVGPHLREVFKDPSKKKVMHGADSDILWLQRDFGIYICNLFDTQQASKVLNLGKNSLEHLLDYFCGVTVDKAYQNADWRQRPLPDDMLKYAREDTHYLLYIYDQMRHRLQSASVDAKVPNDLLRVYKCSYDVCMQLYEKELLTNTSYLKIYGLHEAGFNAQQLSIVAGLCEWRDAIARAEDESTGYIMPNKSLLQIARQMPLTVSKLRQCMTTKHPYVDVNLDSIVELIKSSIRNASAFESAAQLLKTGRQQTAIDQNMGVDATMSSPQGKIGDGVNGQTTTWKETTGYGEEYPKLKRGIVECSTRSHIPSFQSPGEIGEFRKIQDGNKLDLQNESFTISEQKRVALGDNGNPDLISGSTGKVVEKPSDDFRPGRLTSSSQLEINPEVTEQKFERVDNGEGGSNMNGKITKCLSEGFNDQVSCQLKRSDVNEVSNQGTKCSTSLHVKQESTKCNTSQGSSFQPEIGTEEDNTSTSPKESCTDTDNSVLTRSFCGVTEEVLNNTSQDSGTETSTSKSEIDNLSNGKVEQVSSKNEGRTSDTNLSTKFLSYLQINNKKEKTKQIERPQEKASMESSAEGFKSLLTSSFSSSNKLGSCNTSILRRIREDEVTKDFQHAKQYQAFLCPGNQTVE